MITIAASYGYLKAPWYELEPRMKSEPGKRSAEKTMGCYEQFAVGQNPRYEAGRQGKGETYCNIFAWDCTKAMGCEIPHWYNEETGEKSNANLPVVREMTVNRMVDWLLLHGVKFGWQSVPFVDALKSAAEGECVLGAWQNPVHTKSGHVAMLLPNGQTAQAGAQCFFGGTVEASFPKPIIGDTHWWRHA